MSGRYLCTAAGALAAAVAAATPLRAQRGDERSRLDTTLAISADGTVDLSLVSGEIHVTSWNRAQVKIVATTEEGRLQLDASPSRVGLSVRSVDGDMGDTRYDVTIPAGVRLNTESVSGDIITRGGGDVNVHSVSGEITLSDASGRATIESVSGDVHASRIGRGLRVSSVSGDLGISGVSGELNAHTVSGDMELTDIRSSFVRTRTTSGDTRFAGTVARDGTYDFQSHSGDIRLAVPSVGITFSLGTFSGDIDSDFPMTLQPGSRTNGEHMDFSVNGGGARITAQTFSGDITIQRATGGRED